jgi:aspartate/methionine/tyrosine aminotransferase
MGATGARARRRDRIRTRGGTMSGLAQRMSRLGTETAFEVLARARALEATGRKIIHLEIGEPDFDTPAFIRKAAADALEAGFTHYGPSAGLPDFRKTIADIWRAERGIPCDADNVVVVPGGKPIMFFTMLALLEEGDEAIYPNPGFPIYESMINFLGARAVPIPLREERGFDLDVNELESKITSRTKLLVINSPNNPVGSVLSPETVEAIAALARKHNFTVLSDEIYGRIQYEGKHVSIAALPGMAERTVVLDGFSKTYAMTGWRLGFGIMEKGLATHIARLMTNSNSCTATFVQKAGQVALTGPQHEVQAMVAEFRRRREAIVKGLNELPGVTCTMPKGAFYAFPNITGTGMKSADLAKALLEEAGVACLSGTSFGAFGEGYIRFSYANSLENIQTALASMNEFLTVRAK